MKKLFFLFVIYFICLNASSQVMVGGIDLNTTVQMFELNVMAKPFNTKESLFINYGQEGFRLSNYDLMKQGVSDASGKKFEKGEYLKLFQYLMEQGWEKVDQKTVTLGTQTGTTYIFNRKK
jgi:hypothetical protein